MSRLNKKQFGFSFVEAVIGIALFALVSVALVGVLISGYFDVFLAGSRQRATLIAEEGLEAARNIRDAGYANLVDGTYGIGVSGNQFIFTGTSDVVDVFTRQVTISSPSANRKLVTSTVNWIQQEGRPGSVSLSAYLTEWQATVANYRKGLIVYGEGGINSDTIKYRLLQDSGTWSVAQNAADVSNLDTDRGVRGLALYSSATRDEYILISKHYKNTGSTQYIYTQVYSAGVWGNVLELSSWSSGVPEQALNFGGTYLDNGDFVLIYSDNTSVPKVRVWDGTLWSAAISLPNVGGTPSFMVVKNRPGTNEIMVAIQDSSRDTNTVYFNGSSYATGSWTLHAEHSASNTSDQRRVVDFSWSPNNPLMGTLVYTSATSDRSVDAKVWTASGLGGGAWSSAVSSSNQPASRNVTNMNVNGRFGADEFLTCDKDSSTTPNIYCYRTTFTPAFTAATNGSWGATDNGHQYSFGFEYEKSGNQGLIVYSDTTTIPKLKKYTSSSNAFDAAATNMTALTAGTESVKMIPAPDNDDIMVLLADTAQNMYSIIWDGSNNTFYNSPTGWAQTTQGTSGSSDIDQWFDFAWDLNP